MLYHIIIYRASFGGLDQDIKCPFYQKNAALGFMNQQKQSIIVLQKCLTFNANIVMSSIHMGT